MNGKETLSTLSLAILGLISNTPSSGYDLRKVFSNTPIGVFSSSPGAIYPALKRCEKNGWIEGEIDSSSILRPRQVFQLTAAGHEALKEELSHPVTVESVIWQSGDLILRFAFMDGVLTKKRILKFLEEYAKATEEYIATLSEHRKTMEGISPKCGIFALGQGIEAYKSNLRWAKRTIPEFQ
jgi:DNA-binding PadR family transcriptional regulator